MGAMVGWLALFVPWAVWVVFITIAFLFCQTLIADRRAGVIESLGLSWRAIKPQFWGYLLIQVVLGMINGAGAQACYVGALVTMPYIFMVLVTLYRDRFPAVAPVS